MIEPQLRHWFEPLRIAPRLTRSIGGVDRGADGRILVEVRHGNALHRQLVWRKGFDTPAAGVRGFGHVRVPTSLYVTDAIGMGVPGSDLLEGGRLSRSRLAPLGERIDELLGCRVHALIDVGRTLIVTIDRRDDPDETR